VCGIWHSVHVIDEVRQRMVWGVWWAAAPCKVSCVTDCHLEQGSLPLLFAFFIHLLPECDPLQMSAFSTNTECSSSMSLRRPHKLISSLEATR
jgi:hypothetical protein